MAVTSAAPVMAQSSTNQVGSNTDWYVYQEDTPSKTCWAVSVPKETVNTDSSGRPKSVRRSDILLFVTFAPGSAVAGQVSFLGGYPFEPGSDVTMNIGGQDFNLFTKSEDETAWAVTAEEDAKIIAAMKRGASATLTGRSARGTITKDTFSLLGFTASVEEAEKRCAG
ncbi:invasion associated locus B family protein [Celeribacter litoreus]|uniref:invasion associated locus B family protein n=1 Tax=Celeribacter litoreus TaxID=2876714 RepID=UPI001CCA5766|nr:invasion associated locus B family protein [Celeribacter litoreus]